MFEASLAPYNLKPIVAEFYGSKDGVFSLGSQISSVTLQPPGKTGTLSALHWQGAKLLELLGLEEAMRVGILALPRQLQPLCILMVMPLVLQVVGCPKVVLSQVHTHH